MARKDINQTAFAVVQQATGQAETLPESAKAKAGRKGGLKGGKARMAALTDSDRSKLAKQAAVKRWKKPAPSDKGAG